MIIRWREVLPPHFWREAWDEFKVVSVVFIGIVLSTAILLITNLPQTLVLWISIGLTLVLTPSALYWYVQRRHAGFPSFEGFFATSETPFTFSFRNPVGEALQTLTELENHLGTFEVRTRATLTNLQERLRQLEITIAVDPHRLQELRARAEQSTETARHRTALCQLTLLYTQTGLDSLKKGDISTALAYLRNGLEIYERYGGPQHTIYLLYRHAQYVDKQQDAYQMIQQALESLQYTARKDMS